MRHVLVSSARGSLHKSRCVRGALPMRGIVPAQGVRGRFRNAGRAAAVARRHNMRRSGKNPTEYVS
jgi:hypothetical protein